MTNYFQTVARKFSGNPLIVPIFILALSGLAVGFYLFLEDNSSNFAAIQQMETDKLNPTSFALTAYVLPVALQLLAILCASLYYISADDPDEAIQKSARNMGRIAFWLEMSDFAIDFFYRVPIDDVLSPAWEAMKEVVNQIYTWSSGPTMYGFYSTDPAQALWILCKGFVLAFSISWGGTFFIGISMSVIAVTYEQFITELAWMKVARRKIAAYMTAVKTWSDDGATGDAPIFPNLSRPTNATTQTNRTNQASQAQRAQQAAAAARNGGRD